MHLVPRGVLRAVVIFADFGDASGETDPAEIGARVHGHGAATKLFHEQSHGALELEVTVRSDLGWRRLPNPSTAYKLGDGRKQRQFMTDLAARIGADELRFDDYDLVLAVTAKKANVRLSPAYLHVPGTARRRPPARSSTASRSGMTSTPATTGSWCTNSATSWACPTCTPTSPGNPAEPAARPTPARTWSATGT